MDGFRTRRSTIQSRRMGFLARCLASGCMLVVATSGLRAELTPEEVGIVAMARSPASRDLARHYATARNVPRSHVCLIRATPGPVLDRVEWEQSVRPQIREWFAKNDFQKKLRCLVTVWDVPLKIGKQPENSALVGARKAYLEAERDNRWKEVAKIANQVNRLVRDTSDIETVQISPESKTSDLSARLQEVFQQCQQRIQEQGAEIDTKASLQFQQSVLAVNGLVAVAQQDSARFQDNVVQKRSQVDQARGRLLGLSEGRAALESLAATVPRDEKILALVQRSNGLIGMLAWIEAQLLSVEKNETYASFDSELSLLFWPNYPTDRWQPNVLYHRYDGSSDRWLKPVLMVSRLEAPTIQLTKKLVETAIATEKAGLDGTMYLDARGLIKLDGKATGGSYADYDLSLLRLADGMKGLSEIPVVVDTNGELFPEGACPNAALYSGWYAIAKYQDSFEWVPGSIGYHIASSEAAALRNTDVGYWCKRMLEEGVCATLGPVYEPYLTAFPKPDEFFVLLMSGQYTLVEAYYRTKPYNSWVMVLIGDPLYNPFKSNPHFTDQTLPETWRRLIAGTQPGNSS